MSGSRRRPANNPIIHIRRPDNSLFAFAGLWEHWDRETESIYSVNARESALLQLTEGDVPR